jgi:hypothetical protein
MCVCVCVCDLFPSLYRLLVVATKSMIKYISPDRHVVNLHLLKMAPLTNLHTFYCHHTQYSNPAPRGVCVSCSSLCISEGRKLAKLRVAVKPTS